MHNMIDLNQQRTLPTHTHYFAWLNIRYFLTFTVFSFPFVEVITFLLSTEIIPLCLRIMESGSELSKTVATFILQKILLDETGLSYICQTYERFSHVAMILGKMVLALSKEASARLLKHVVRCYLRLSDNPRAREALRQCLPEYLKDSTFAGCLKDDTSTKRWLSQLMKNLQEVPNGPGGGGGGMSDPRGIPMPPWSEAWWGAPCRHTHVHYLLDCE